MKIIIVFSSPNNPEYELIWKPLIGSEANYIGVNNDGDKIYPFDGSKYCENYEWNTDSLVTEISGIVRGNNSSKCVVMLHDYKIPHQLEERLKDIRFIPHASGTSKLYDDYVTPFKGGDIRVCFDNLWNAIKSTEEGNLTRLSVACVVCQTMDQFLIAFGDDIAKRFEETDVCNELTTKVNKSSEEYKDIKYLFDHIKSDSDTVDHQIINNATSSLSRILKG